MTNPNDRLDQIESVLEATFGVCSDTCFAKAGIKRILDDQIPALREEIKALHQGLEDMRVIARAKGILMDRWKITEKDAHLKLQSASKNRSTKMAEVARFIIEAEDIANGK
jgi:hypothetical protein